MQKPDWNPLYIGLILIQIGVIIYVIWRAMKKRSKKVAPPNEYEALRMQAMKITPEALKIAIPNSETLVYGVVMDLDIGDAILTVSAYINGAANMFFSTGGGKTGGGKSPEVGHAAVDLVMMAQEYLDKATTNVMTDLPPKGYIRFYFLTNQRTFMIEEQMEKLESSDSVLFPLFQKGNDVVTAIHGADNRAVLN